VALQTHWTFPVARRLCCINGRSRMPRKSNATTTEIVVEASGRWRRTEKKRRVETVTYNIGLNVRVTVNGVTYAAYWRVGDV